MQEDIFGEEFLLTRPLLRAISTPDPVVLLIDEIDKTDQEFEAMLLEVLSDFQISIPELGVIEARTRPIVVLTSNNSRELTEALKRRCLYLWLDYPEVEREMEIVRLHSPELDEKLARRLVEVVHMVRSLDIKKPPSIAESIDWARALLLLGADDIDREPFEQTMSIIVKHRSDLEPRRRARRGEARRGGQARPRPRGLARAPAMAANSDWVWTHTDSTPIPGGFLNHWHARIPVGDAEVECDGVCSVRLRDGLIADNRVWFDRSELLAVLAR